MTLAAAAPQPPAYLDHLNPAQLQAVEALDGPVLVLAGAGTGKTRVLTTRLAHLMRTGKALPGEILAVTFTNKAAAEMKHRVSTLMHGQPVEGWWLGTFHALAARMLRVNADMVGLTSGYTIIDEDDQIRVLKQLMEAAGLDVKKHNPRALAGAISRWKDKALTPAHIGPNDAGDLAGGKAPLLYSQYQARLKSLNACDFGDLLLHMITLFKDPNHADVLHKYQRRFKYIMVDEYQDTNVAQYLWLRLLAMAHGNICCVGDDDQSIYGWRGAEIGNILKFEKDFPGARIIRLEQNYRSTGHILDGAGGVIGHNTSRLGKTLWSESGKGEKIKVHSLWDGEGEARWVTEQIEQLQREKINPNDIAVLVRAGFQMREFEDRFLVMNIPYRVIGGPRFYERAEIRDALAYMRVIAGEQDDLALERIINVPKRGIGDGTLEKLYTHARARGISLMASIRDMIASDELRGKVRETLQALVADFDRWRGLLSTMPHPQVMDLILEDTGYIAMWKAEKTPDAQGRIENLRELISGMAEYETLEVFLEHVALVLDNAENTDQPKVSLMTLHGAKGLEFKCVFLPGWEEGLFPSQRAVDENGLSGLEEERRLAYVGITRARERAFISHVSNRRIYGNWTSSIASRFIEELPDDAITVTSDTGIYGGGRSLYGTGSPAPSVHRETVPPAQIREDTRVGARVHHDKFGPGTVVHVDGHKLDIKFDQAGLKRVMESFVSFI